jgi:hypothetical protein
VRRAKNLEAECVPSRAIRWMTAPPAHHGGDNRTHAVAAETEVPRSPEGEMTMDSPAQDETFHTCWSVTNVLRVLPIDTDKAREVLRLAEKIMCHMHGDPASTSSGVKCSRVRSSAFFDRFGGTVRFTSVGATTREWDFAMRNRWPRMLTVRSLQKVRTVCKVAGSAWPPHSLSGRLARQDVEDVCVQGGLWHEGTQNDPEKSAGPDRPEFGPCNSDGIGSAR